MELDLSQVESNHQPQHYQGNGHPNHDQPRRKNLPAEPELHYSPLRVREPRWASFAPTIAAQLRCDLPVPKIRTSLYNSRKPLIAHEPPLVAVMSQAEKGAHRNAFDRGTREGSPCRTCGSCSRALRTRHWRLDRVKSPLSRRNEYPRDKLLTLREGWRIDSLTCCQLTEPRRAWVANRQRPARRALSRPRPVGILPDAGGRRLITLRRGRCC